MLPPKMTNLFDRLPHRLRLGGTLAALALVAVLLAGCGPGTGGTGTGPIGVTLGYTGAAANGSATTPGLGCTDACADTLLRLDTERVELVTPCLRFVFNGPWSVDAMGLAIVDGAVEPGAAVGSPRATLRLQFSENTAASARVTLTLTDDTGRALASATLQRNDAAATAPSACRPL